jgi:hypothetical protein
MNRKEIDEKIARNKKEKIKSNRKEGCIKFFLLMFFLGISILFINKCVNTDSDTTPSNPTYVHDESDTSYWKSVQKEKDLRDAGYDGAANMEENARHDYNHGGGYHSKDGSRQVDFQGSQEQKDQLDEMKRRGW